MNTNFCHTSFSYANNFSRKLTKVGMRRWDDLVFVIPNSDVVYNRAEITTRGHGSFSKEGNSQYNFTKKKGLPPLLYLLSGWTSW